MKIAIDIKPSLSTGPNNVGIHILLSDIAKRINDGNISGSFWFERDYSSGATETERKRYAIKFVVAP